MQLLESRGRRLRRQDFAVIAADHGAGDPNQEVCRHASVMQSLGCVIFDPLNSEMWTLSGRPCQKQYESLDLTGPVRSLSRNKFRGLFRLELVLQRDFTPVD